MTVVTEVSVMKVVIVVTVVTVVTVMTVVTVVTKKNPKKYFFSNEKILKNFHFTQKNPLHNQNRKKLKNSKCDKTQNVTKLNN